MTCPIVVLGWKNSLFGRRLSVFLTYPIHPSYFSLHPCPNTLSHSSGEWERDFKDFFNNDLAAYICGSPNAPVRDHSSRLFAALGVLLVGALRGSATCGYYCRCHAVAGRSEILYHRYQIKRMRSRLSLGSLLIVVAIAATQFLTGCKSQIDDPAPSDFGQIRVVNFADQTSPVDVYIQGAGQPTDTLPVAQNLNFGLTTPYINNLPASAGGTVYHVSIHPVNNRQTEIAHADVTIKPTEKWTVAVYHNVGNSTYPTDIYQDINNGGSGTPATDKVYVRFLNAYDGDAQYPLGLNIKVGDNLNGNPITATPQKFRTHNDYQAIPFKTDTTYTFFLTDPNGKDSVVTRIAGQSFDPGSYHTIVFAADLSKVGKNAASTAGDALDSIRLRIFDDNGIGNDQTSPTIPQSLRFNFINAYVPPPNADPTKQRTYSQLGIVVNNDGNITFPGMNQFDVAPALSFFVPTYMDGSQLVHVTQFTSIPLTAAVDIKGYQTDNVPAGARGQLLFDYKAGARLDIKSDMPTSFIAFDVPPLLSKAADSTSVGEVAVPIPDNAVPGQSNIVLVNALASVVAGPTASYASMTVNGVQDVSFGVPTSGKKPSTYDNKIVLPSGTPVTIVATLPKKVPTFPNPENFTVTFTPKDGKIYEVVFVGVRGTTNSSAPQFIIVETNPTVAGGQDALR